MIVQREIAAIQSTSCSHRTYFGGQNVIPLFGKAAIPKDWSKAKDSLPQRLIVLPFAIDITEFYPSPDWATIDRTRQERPQESAFQISSQSEVVCSSYDGFKLREMNLARFESITSNPSGTFPSSNPRSLAMLRIHPSRHCVRIHSTVTPPSNPSGSTPSSSKPSHGLPSYPSRESASNQPMFEPSIPTFESILPEPYLESMHYFEPMN